MLISYVSTLYENFSLNVAYISDSVVTKLLSVGTKVWQLFVQLINPERFKSEKILHITAKLCGTAFMVTVDTVIVFLFTVHPH
jgi:hypothetical protein